MVFPFILTAYFSLLWFNVLWFDLKHTDNNNPITHFANEQGLT